MHLPASKDGLAAALLIISRAPARCGTTKVVAVDGPSGSGKTDFTRALGARLPRARVLHMDDLYPGWDGLTQAISDLHTQVLTPLARGGPAGYQRWDWEHGRYGERHHLPDTALLLVEGVGSGAEPGWALESALIWLEADRDERFRRAVQRDGESYLPHWQRWAAHEDALFALDKTRSRADLIINTSA
jgi:uridine kinase